MKKEINFYLLNLSCLDSSSLEVIQDLFFKNLKNIGLHTEIKSLFHNKNEEEKDVLIKNFISECVLNMNANYFQEFLKQVHLEDKHVAYFWKKIISCHKSYGTRSILETFLSEQYKKRYHFNDWKTSILKTAYEANAYTFIKDLSELGVVVMKFEYLPYLLNSKGVFQFIMNFPIENVSIPKVYNGVSQQVVSVAAKFIICKEIIDLIHQMIEKYKHDPQFLEDINRIINTSSIENQNNASSTGITSLVFKCNLDLKLKSFSSENRSKNKI